MRRPIGFALVLLVGLVVALPASASGSIGPGSIKPGGRADYSRGKAIVFKELVCRTCPIKKRGFNRARGLEIKEALTKAAQGDLRRSTDEHVKLVCQRPQEQRRRRRRGQEADCGERIRLVIAYLDRRFRL